MQASTRASSACSSAGRSLHKLINDTAMISESTTGAASGSTGVPKSCDVALSQHGPFRRAGIVKREAIQIIGKKSWEFV